MLGAGRWCNRATGRCLSDATGTARQDGGAIAVWRDGGSMVRTIRCVLTAIARFAAKLPRIECAETLLAAAADVSPAADLVFRGTAS